MLRRLLLLPLLALALGATLTTAPAGAATGVRADPRGDAPAAIDLTRLRVVTAPGVVRFALSVRQLRSRGTFVVGMYEPNGTGAIEFVVTRRAGQTRVRTRLTDFDDTFPARCPGVRARWDAKGDVIRVRGPEKCLYFARQDRTWGVFASSRLGRSRDRVEAFSVRRG